jgi:Tripartite tricarboxylate transporter family receptor
MPCCGYIHPTAARHLIFPDAAAPLSAPMQRPGSIGGIASPLSVERRACRSGGLPDRDDESAPQTGVVAAIVFLIHVCGQIGLQDDRTKALTDQSTDGDLALLQVTINRRIEIGGPEGDQPETLADAMEHIKAGRTRALGVTTATRVPVLPDVPAIAEFIPGYEAVGWLGVAAPKDTPPAIIEMLNKAINAGLADPKIKQTIADWGETAFATSPVEFGTFIAAENEKWGKVIRAANIKPE